MTTTTIKTVLGPLWKIYSNPAVYGICIDAYDDVYYYQGNGIAEKSKPFKTPKELDALINRMLKFTDKTITPGQSNLYLNLDPYNQVDIVFPPMAVRGPALIIRRLPVKKVTLDDLITYKALDTEGKDLLMKCLTEAKGLLVAGHLGSGKTTLLNTLIEAIPLPQRVVTLERYYDLVIHREKVLRLQAANQKAEEMYDLVTTAGRMYADHMVISSFQGPEVMHFLEIARNTCTGIGLITGDSPTDALKRLETKAVVSSEGMSLEDARYAIAQAFKHVVYQEKKPDGKRVVSVIAEIQYQAGELALKVIYKR